MARLHGRHVDYDPDVQDALTGAHGQLPLFDAEASTPSSGPEFAETFRRIVTQCGVDRFLHGGRSGMGLRRPVRPRAIISAASNATGERSGIRLPQGIPRLAGKLACQSGRTCTCHYPNPIGNNQTV